MKEHAAHWQRTLLGAEIWNNVETRNQPVNDLIDTVHDQALHTRFPFNLVREETSRARHSAAPPAQRPTGTTKAPPRSFALRSTQAQQPQPQRPPIVLFTAEQATPTNPLLEFRGGETWARFPQNRRSLGIDVYLPLNTSSTTTAAAAESTAQTEDPNDGEEAQEEEDEDDEVEEQVEILALEQFFPLIHFRHLRSLKITGMVQSYQKYIWQAAWLNTGLEELELSMVCEPRLRRSFTGVWPCIKGGWTMNPTHYSAPVYYGTGAGTLPRTIGEGEYLDKLALEKAKVCAMVHGPTRNRLSLRTLTLTGFVVDADPILLWFDPARLKCLHFKDFCVDAGFYLCEAMHRVSVLFPRRLGPAEGDEAVVARRVHLRTELKVVQLRGGRKVGEMPFTGPQCLREGREGAEEEGAGVGDILAPAPAPADTTAPAEEV
ncbi:hypothetical protein BO86DRAFT_440098 [Aspergillus japonicus CBS 114.51]|uniref:Uncharacterized protein n=1 Tax=Aspergillus japonicus CBS 114.51 TaxID=1448312 RepID=A0A8T8WPX5_ASPJA|nr:hypothetical protein BO86DRAFT_440098 [Aspergillus japonicus CBS 114.51]RAH77723.1 hypothetical protein BO86DRAFT_440098 [Aspergillus japonicus CBS 114.51]